MRIPCPYCGDRDFSEFAYLGDATLRASRPFGAERRAGVPRLCLSARQSGRPASRILASRLGLPVLAGRDARHARPRDPRGRVRRAGAMSGRLPKGGLIDRGVALGFRFDGKPLGGHPGDTLASALLASGETLVGRSFKYHRPRGVLTAGPEEPNALVELRDGARREPNTRGDDGRTVRRAGGDEPEPLSVAALRSRRDQFAGVADPDRRLLLQDLHVAGGVLGKALRAADPPLPPGLGRASGRDRSRPVREGLRASATCWSIGGGPAGLAAALAAGRRGARVILARRRFSARRPADWPSDARSTAGRASQWAADAAAANSRRCRQRADSAAGRRCSASTTAASMARWSASRIIFRRRRRISRASGSGASSPSARCWPPARIERPIVFGGNDRPGVMLASAVRTYLNRFAVACGRDAVIFTTGDDGWRTAADMSAAGLQRRGDRRRAGPKSRLRCAVSRGRRGFIWERRSPTCAAARRVRGVEIVDRGRAAIPGDGRPASRSRAATTRRSA